MSRPRKKDGMSVTVYDAEQRESVSFTVYPTGQRAFEVARMLHSNLPSYWAATKLTDRRHKRR